MQTHSLDDLISFTEAAGLLGKSYWHVYRAVRLGRIEAVTMPAGNSRALVRSSVKAYAQSRGMQFAVA